MTKGDKQDGQQDGQLSPLIKIFLVLWSCNSELPVVIIKGGAEVMPPTAVHVVVQWA